MTYVGTFQGIILALCVPPFVRSWWCGFLALRALRTHRQVVQASAGVDPIDSHEFQVPPVSIVALAHGDAALVVRNVLRLVEQRYPDHEVIVVCEQEGAVAALARAFDLRAHDTPVRQTVRSRVVRRVYASRSVAQLRVIEKAPAGRADAFNCGLNFARHRYVCTVDARVALARDALRHAMVPVIDEDEQTVVIHAQALTDGAARAAVRGGAPASMTFWSALCSIEDLRDWLVERAAWNRSRILLTGAAFSIWPIDALGDAAGFSTDARCEDVEMSIRLCAQSVVRQCSCRVPSVLSVAGTTEEDGSLIALVARYANTQWGMAEALWRHRAQLIEHYRGLVSRARLLTLVAGVTVGPWLAGLAMSGLTVGLVLGVFSPYQAAAIAIALAFASGASTNLLLLVVRHLSPAEARAGFWRLAVAGLAEPLLSGPLRCFAHLLGGRTRLTRRGSSRQAFSPPSVRSPTPTGS